MVILRKTFQELKDISSSKGLQIFMGSETAGDIQLLAHDDIVLYESYLTKNSADYISFMNNEFQQIIYKKNNNPDWDTINITFPSDTTELHTYLSNGVTVQYVLTTYENNSKKQIVKVEKTVA